jgi:uncharacterized protein YjbI with pentapeptide repeats
MTTFSKNLHGGPSSGIMNWCSSTDRGGGHEMTDDDVFEDSGTMRRPLHDPAYQALREGDTATFSELTADREAIDLSYCDLGGVDLRKVDITNIDLQGARLKRADLRGLDLSQHNMHGVTLYNARVSGVLFPAEISADEIRMSLREGTRLRHKKA